MNSVSTSLIVFGCLCVAGLVGLRIRAALPQEHLAAETKDAVRIGMALIATLSALVIGLLIASANSQYDAERNETNQFSAQVVLLDRVLAMYGPETATSREQVREVLAVTIAHMWPDASAQGAQMDPRSATGEGAFATIEALSPKTDEQRDLKSEAVKLALDLGQLRWLLFAQAETSMSPTLLVIVVSWLSIIVVSIGLYAPTNATVVASVFMVALAVSGAIFLILELSMPFHGVIRISDAPMRSALSHLGN